MANKALDLNSLFGKNIYRSHEIIKSSRLADSKYPKKTGHYIYM